MLCDSRSLRCTPCIPTTPTPRGPTGWAMRLPLSCSWEATVVLGYYDAGGRGSDAAEAVRRMVSSSAKQVGNGCGRPKLGQHANIPWYKMAGALPCMLMFQRSCIQGVQNIIFATIEDSNILQSGGCLPRWENWENRGRRGEELPRKLWERFLKSW